MAVTNAISGIVIVGAILVAGAAHASETVLFAGISLTQIIGLIAIFLASINIFGGFVVTNRILAMFKKKQQKEVK
jgi:NAD(P) transhydrogenase subunit alpha